MWHPEMCFTIHSPLFYQFISPASALFGVRPCLGHPQIPQMWFFCLFPPHYSFFFTFAFTLSLPLMYFYLLCLFLILFDPSVKSVLGQASRSPCCYDRGLAAEWRWPLNSQTVTLLFLPLSASSLSLYTATLLFISEPQFQQGSHMFTERTWKGLE